MPYVMVVEAHNTWIVWVNADKVKVVVTTDVAEWDIAVLEPWELLIVHVLIQDEALSFAVYFVGIIKVNAVGVSPELARFLHVDTLVIAINGFRNCLPYSPAITADAFIWVE